MLDYKPIDITLVLLLPVYGLWDKCQIVPVTLCGWDPKGKVGLKPHILQFMCSVLTQCETD